MSKFYITTTEPYVNSDPHLGFAMEIVRADVIARFHRLLGDDVVFNTGTDEHGQKIYQKALQENKTPQEYCNENAEKYLNLKRVLNLSFTNFIRNTDEKHVKAAQEFWRRCKKKGDLYKATYQIKYCVGCELEKTDSELENGKCPIHTNLALEIYNEENYFFRFSKYQKQLLDLYNKTLDFVVPNFRLEEIKKFVSSGLKDFSVSRLKEKMPWGVDVPDDPKHVMYVWFDALINYVSTLGWPDDEKNFRAYWPVVQLAGKDNLRQQSAMWQAMLMSAGLPNSKQIYVEGFITANGQKMSKSLGNVVDPVKLVNTYGIDPVRYYLLREIPSFDDGDFSERRFLEVYNSDLANGIGNLVSRVAKLSESVGLEVENSKVDFDEEFSKALSEYRFNDAVGFVLKETTEADLLLDKTAPWKMIKDGKTEEAKEVLFDLINRVRKISLMLEPLLPETSDEINKIFEGPKIKAAIPLFPRI